MSNAAKHRKRAAEFELQKQFDKAIGSYRRAIEVGDAEGSEVDVALLNKVGDLTLRLGRVPEAVESYERAVDHYAAVGLFNNAIALCNKILRHAPGRMGVYLTLGRVCARKGMRGDATRNFLEYASRMQQEGRTDEGMRALADVSAGMPELEQVRRLVEEHAARAGIALPTAVDAAVGSGAVGAVNSADSLVFLDIDYESSDDLTPAFGAMTVDLSSPPPAVPKEEAAPSPPARTKSLDDLMIFDPTSGDDDEFDFAEMVDGLEATHTDVDALVSSDVPSLLAQDNATAVSGPMDAPPGLTDALGFEPSEVLADVASLELLDGLVADEDALLFPEPLTRPVELDEEGTQTNLVIPPDTDEPIDEADDTPADAASFDGAAAIRDAHVADRADTGMSGLDNARWDAPRDDVGAGLDVEAATPDDASAKVPADLTADFTAPFTVDLTVDLTADLTADLTVDLTVDLTAGLSVGDDRDSGEYESAVRSGEEVPDTNGAEAVVSWNDALIDESSDAAAAGAEADPGAIDNAQGEAQHEVCTDAEVAYHAPLSSAHVTREGLPEPLLDPVDSEWVVGAADGLEQIGDIDAEDIVWIEVESTNLMSDVSSDEVDGPGELVPAPATEAVTIDVPGDHPEALPFLAVNDAEDKVSASTIEEECGTPDTEEVLEFLDIELPPEEVLDDELMQHANALSTSADTEFRRLNPHDFILPGELPPIVFPDELLATAIASLHEPSSNGLSDFNAFDRADASDRTATFDRTDTFDRADTSDHAEHDGERAQLTPDDASPALVFLVNESTDFNENEDPAPAVEPTDEPAGEPGLDVQAFGDLEAILTPSTPAVAMNLALDRCVRLREEVEAHPGDWARRRRLAEAYLEAGELETGLSELAATVLALEIEGDLKEASRVTDELIRVAPDVVAHHMKRVELAVRLGDRDRLRESYLDLADAMVRTGQASRAESVYIRVLELDPWDDRARAALGSAAPPPPAPRPAPPSNQDGYVSLADWLSDEGSTADTRMRVKEPTVTGDEDADFSRLLQHFREGVSRSLGDEDYASHYDLGVAYKEMGLLDDAIAEFQRALRSPTHRLPAYEALGQCFLEQGSFPVAVTVLSRALHEPGLDDEQRVGVLYLLGYACEALQRRDEARSYFQRVYAIDIHFRDVAERLAALEGGA